MTEVAADSPVKTKSSGRGLFWAGLGLSILAIVAMIGQYQLKMLVVPWYVPIMTTLGALLLLGSIIHRRSIPRIVFFGLIGVLAGLQWLFLVSMSKLPEYAGPARAGVRLPPFECSTAAGDAFTEQSLHRGTPTVITFFRGRW